MGQTERAGPEAAAVEHIANAAREVQLSSLALEERFNSAPYENSAALPLARLTAAITDLQAARDAFDALLARKSLR